ncbi:MAG: hypothetical protein CMJ84_11135 [Planctomycetes bacterium]|jgi:hypothetical protein|nr:hypothetical protein [Planctomycetota bacterium]MDP6409228.1 hypothetical protein [Planctomycetota bacterium]
MSATYPLILFVCSVSLLAGRAAAGPAQGVVGAKDPRLAEVRALYGRDRWPSGSRRAGFDLGAAVLEGYAGARPAGLEGLVTRRFQGTRKGDRGFVVELRVGDTVAEAQEQLLSWLASASTPERVPRARELGVGVGELGFVGRSRYGDDHPEWIAFVRGNVALRIVARDLRSAGRPRLGAVARALDLGVAAGRLLEPDEVVEHPLITRLACARGRAVAGERLRIEVAAEDPLGGIVRFFWHLSGPATGYMERDEQGAWWLHTTGPGELKLTAVAVGSGGTFTRRSLALVLEDD